MRYIRNSKDKNNTIMNKKANAKREAYAKKQEEKGRNLIMWIIGVLIALGVIYAIWASFMM